MLIRHLANAGVLLCGSSNILIDGLTCPDGLYPSTSDVERLAIQLGIPPFEALDLMIFTHEHADHFDPDACARFMAENKEAVVMMTRASFSMIEDKIGADAKSRETWGRFSVSFHPGGMKRRTVPMFRLCSTDGCFPY